MSEFKESIIEAIQEYQENLPEKFANDVDPRMETLDKEINRSNYLFDILENALLVMDKNDLDTAELRLKKNFSDTLKHHIESGGAGSEALLRLIALGVIEEVPIIKITDDTEYVPVKKSKMTVDYDENAIELTLLFNAHVPDNEGNETWDGRTDDGNVCIANVKMKLKNRATIESFLEKLHEDYSDVLDIKYPDRKL